MKITHTTSGKAYELTPGTQIEIERTNLFFNDYGEQSYPVDLPDTPLNRELCGHPEDLANRSKPRQDIDCVISDGAFSMPCRQAVLGAKRGEKITTSFYMNEGSFLARMQQVPLRDVFGDETVPGVSTVAEGIAFCEGLMDDSHPHFSIAPLIVDLDGERHLLNRMHHMDEQGNITDVNMNYEVRPGMTPSPWQLYNKWSRVEKKDNHPINIPAGCYITPLMRMAYLLERLFGHFGYRLVGGFLTSYAPLDKMVVLGNTADALVNGYIFLADLVPDCLCSDLLEVVRRKFCCEFVPDEVARTVRMELFGDATEAAPIALDSYVAENPEIVYGDPRQLKLYSKEVLGSTVDFGGERDVKSRFPTAYIDNASEYGYQYVRDGYKAHRSGVIKQVLADMRLPYYSADPGFEDYEVEVPDIQWSMETVTLTWINSNGNTGGDKVEGAYIGEANWLNSKLVTFGSEEVTDTEKERTEELENHKAGVLLALIYVPDNLLNRAVYRTSASGYTLGYNGDKGIYETFYRNFDTLLRNALHTVTVPLLLTDEMKQTMSMTSRVQIGNRDYLINKLNYVVGDSAAPNPTELLTANPQHPIGYGLGTRDIFPERKYTWRREYRVTELTESEWIAAGYDKETVVTSLTTYLPDPTDEQMEAGGRYYEHDEYISYAPIGGHRPHGWLYERHHIWYEPVLSSPAAAT